MSSAKQYLARILHVLRFALKLLHVQKYNTIGVTGQNGIGQYGTDKMVWTKWCGQNGSNFYRFQFN